MSAPPALDSVPERMRAFKRLSSFIFALGCNFFETQVINMYMKRQAEQKHADSTQGLVMGCT
jgi:hypothetical protein